MATIDETLHATQAALAADADIETYCQAQFSKSVTVYLGSDPDDPPPAVDYPLVVIYAVPRAARGQVSREISREIVLGAGVYNDTIDRATPKQVTYEGFPQAERLRELAETCVLAALLGTKVDVGSETFTSVIFPIFRSDTRIEINERASQRGPAR